MCRNGVLAAVLAAVLGLALLTSGTAWARFAGPGPGITGNDTGGIFPYSPDIEGSYRDIAAAHCARWGRLSQITSVHRKYGDYVSFVCIDKPNMIH
jgi:hypothetical protein